jgi:integrase
MGKRGNGEGSIYQVRNRKTGKKDRWVGVYTVHTATGTKRRELSGKTRTEVAAKLTRAMADRDGGLVFDAGKLTAGKYLDRWLSDSVRDTVKLTTYQGYERNVRRHLQPTLGRIKLKSLTPTHVRGLYRERLDSGLSPRMVQLIHTTLHKALKQAVADGLIPRNVTEAVKAPKISRKEQSLTARSFKPLLESAGLPSIRFHDLRHTCATILLQAGKHPKYVQELLGHATISITLDTYSHVIEGMEGGLGDALDEALG